ncbi:hypothetical protein DSO57_1000263 [Entomophthora muscae]|uniref:Uncharacterized protein n=1 Tax=Entomophthora muscae TaxID=34485 RepID=A0ACC2SYC0_9FUNG|nr:hypothetical protein DSO57_1000263 [Entomophthora muscae]
MSMYGANDQDKATTLLNQLDATSTDLIIPHMLQNDQSYAAAKQALLYKFGSVARAQVLTVSGSLTVHDAHMALRSAVKPYEALYCTLMPAFQEISLSMAWRNTSAIEGIPLSPQFLSQA